MIDWGIVGRLDADTHLLFRRMIEAALGDDTAWADIAAIFMRHYGEAMRDVSLFEDREFFTAALAADPAVRGHGQPVE